MQTQIREKAKEIRLFPHQAKALRGAKRFTALIGGTGGGKALDIETLIPTPAGFRKMGDIQVGDIVYDGIGKETAVTYVSPTYLNHKCYKITFDDGSEIMADEDHLWVVQNAKQRKNTARTINNKLPKECILPTKELKKHSRIGLRLNYSTNIVAAQGEDRVLLIPPYTLGVWLGDGTSIYAIITTADEEVIENIRAEGVPISQPYESNSGKARSYRLIDGEPIGRNQKGQFEGGDTIHGKLKKLGMLGNKHIPSEYLFASYNQRLALLQGIMDTDGHIRQDGICEIALTRQELIKNVSILLSSLGIKNRITKKTFFAFNKTRVAYRIKFKPSCQVFKLKRKIARLKSSIRPSAKRRFIKKIDETKSIPVKCISVASEEKTYLCGESFVITHNTFTGPVWLYQEISKYPKDQFFVIAPTYKMLTRATVPTLVETFRGTQAEGDHKPSLGQYILPSGGIIWFGSADNPETLEAGQYRAAWLDEAGQMKYQVWVVIQARLGQKMGRALLTTTPYAMNWLYSEFYKRYKENDQNYEVINFASTDNPLYPKEEFERARKTLSPTLFEMRYQGYFRKMEGLIYPDFDTNHIVDDFPIPGDWKERGAAGQDWGFNNPAVTLYGAIDDDDVLYIYREIYRQGSLLSELSREMDKNVFHWADPSGLQHIEELRILGINIDAANNDVNAGIEKVNERIRTGRMKIFKSCKNLIDEFETYHWQEGKDKPFKEDDHCVDALRYLVMGLSDYGGKREIVWL